MTRFCFILLVLALAPFQQITAAPKPKMKAEKPASDKPIVNRLEPMGIQRGVATTIRLIGANLQDVHELKFSQEKLKGEFVKDKETKATEAWITVTADAALPRGTYEVSVVGEKGESGKAKLYVDDLPVISEIESNRMAAAFTTPLPSVFWGSFEQSGDIDTIEFEAKTGQSVVFDVAAESLGSKANVQINLLDENGSIVAANGGFDGNDPLLVTRIPRTGRYNLRLSEETMAGSPNHFYRVSMGEFPIVVGCFPLSVGVTNRAEVELLGYNIAPGTKVSFAADKPAQMEVPVDTTQFRLRKAIKVQISDQREIVESEPNDVFLEAQPIAAPVVVGGRLWNRNSAGADADVFRFRAKVGQKWVIETDAARRGSPVDTKVEILHADGKPVPRLLLQAVRDSQINFRSIDSMTGDVRVENWEEMELNEWMYLQGGEVCRIFRMPEGPDSGFQFYRSANRRICYFDTSATAHALDEPCYIVEPHPPGSNPVPNGLPLFRLNYANDDDGERELGSDSRLNFTAPADGIYLIRVTDSRGAGGDRFAYRLIVRESRPDFTVTLGGANPTVSPGSGQEFTLGTDRMDEFDGDIRVDISGVPDGFYVSTPIVIQSGHLQASGTIMASTDAREPSAEAVKNIKVTATAVIDGKNVTKEVNGFGKITLGDKPKLMVAIEPYDAANTNFNVRTISDSPMEITIAPGQTIPVWLKIKRDGHEEVVTFTVDNLPHGVIVDNIGLNGVLIPKDETERQIFLRAAKWVPNTDRLVYCQARQAGNPTSFPVLIKVRKPASQVAAQ